MLRELLLGGPEGPGCSAQQDGFLGRFLLGRGTPGHHQCSRAGHLPQSTVLITAFLRAGQIAVREGKDCFGGCCFNDSPSLPSLGTSGAGVMAHLPPVWFWRGSDSGALAEGSATTSHLLRSAEKL